LTFGLLMNIIKVMFIEAIKLIGLPVASLDTQSKIGDIEELIIDPENGHFLGFMVKTGLFSEKVLASIDVSDWDPNGIVIENEEYLVSLEEIVKIKQIVNEGLILRQMKAKTESGKNLGKVENFLLDTNANIVVKYYLRDLMGDTRVIGADRVIRIEKKTVIFSDDIVIPRGKLKEQTA